MAILPNLEETSVPVTGNNYTTTPTSTAKTPVKQQPQPITIEEYLKRQQRRTEERLTAIPPTQKPKRRRAGRIVKLRRKLAALKNIVSSETPPSWERASEIWEQIDAITHELKAHKNK